MEKRYDEALEKVKRFFYVSLGYYGKEIGLASNQVFSIDQICDADKERGGKFEYSIQYGFPQSGCVCIDFQYSKSSNSFSITSVEVYAPPMGKEMIAANFSPQFQDGPISINFNFGMDMGTEKHEGISKISENPNALNMLDMAIVDLNQAVVMGDCLVSVPNGSDRIPCCVSTFMPKRDENTSR